MCSWDFTHFLRGRERATKKPIKRRWRNSSNSLHPWIWHTHTVLPTKINHSLYVDPLYMDAMGKGAKKIITVYSKSSSLSTSECQVRTTGDKHSQRHAILITKLLQVIPFELYLDSQKPIPFLKLTTKATEKWWLEDYFPFGNAFFQRQTVSFRDG